MRRMIVLASVVTLTFLFFLVYVASYQGVYKEKLSRCKREHTQAEYAVDKLCSDSRVVVKSGPYLTCDDARQTASRDPYDRAFYQTLEEISICNKTCVLLWKSVADNVWKMSMIVVVILVLTGGTLKTWFDRVMYNSNNNQYGYIPYYTTQPPTTHQKMV